MQINEFTAAESVSLTAQNDGSLHINGFGESHIITKKVSLMTDSATLCVRGNVNCGECVVTLLGFDEGGCARELWSSGTLLSEFDIEHEFDPISYSVYAAASLFAIKISSSLDSDITITSLALSENEAVQTSVASASTISRGAKQKAPRRSLFIGNSLIFGMGGFGMCSSAPDKDYFYHVTSYIKSLRPDAICHKLYGSEFEHSENMDMLDKWFREKNEHSNASPEYSFTADTELVVIQLGDNINTDLKFENFKKSGDILINTIKEKSPRARIIWVHGWYSRTHVYDEIVALTLRHNIERLDICPARSYENEAHDKDEFTALDSTVKPIKDTWRTHPGDSGMRAIADMLIDFLNIE